MTQFEKYKFDAVYKYLSIGFPGLLIDQAYDEDQMAQTFSVNDNDEVYVIKFDKKYWDRCDANTLFKRLKILDVAGALRNNPEKNVIVNRSLNLGFEPK